MKKEQTDSVQEYKRTCNVCGKVWHSLASREDKIAWDSEQGNCDKMVECCTGWAYLAASAQEERNRDANKSSLDKLRSCPECHSANYKEEVVSYDKEII